MNVKIYIKPTCPFCKRALQILRKRGANLDIIDIAANPGRRQDMIDESGRKTVPQIFIEGKHVGGCDDLIALQKAGKI